MAVLAILVFSVAYARNARRGMPRAMLAALLAYGVAVVVLQALTLPLWAGFIAVLAGLLVAPMLFGPAPQETPASGKPANDLPWRMLAGAVLALSVTYAASALGPRLSGLFAMFPVMSTVLVGFSHRANGPGFAVALLSGMIKGYVAFAVFCVTLSPLLRHQSIGTAFLLATGAALLVQLAMKWIMGAAQRASRPNAA